MHEEVLRLFTATVGKLSAEQLASYLQMTLQHSRKSRKCGPLSCSVDWPCTSSGGCLTLEDTGFNFVTLRCHDVRWSALE